MFKKCLLTGSLCFISSPQKHTVYDVFIIYKQSAILECYTPTFLLSPQCIFSNSHSMLLSLAATSFPCIQLAFGMLSTFQPCFSCLWSSPSTLAVDRLDYVQGWNIPGVKFFICTWESRRLFLYSQDTSTQTVSINCVSLHWHKRLSPSINL